MTARPLTPDQPPVAPSRLWRAIITPDGLAVAVLVLLALSLFGPHLLGQSRFVGNSDRLYTFLNVRLFEVEQLRAHGSVPAWTDRLLMGEPLDGLGATAFGAFNASGQGIAAWVRGDVAGSSARLSLWVNLLR